MKIGDFARKYGLNITTVRYYVERALLTPERKNNQYIFNKSCMEDMEKILKYKRLRFSLEEIELLFFLEKTSKFRDDIILEIFSDLLNKKKRELEEDVKEISSIVKCLEDEIKNFSFISCAKDNSPNGIPFTFIPYLYCPVCQTPLSLESVNISNNKISSGKLLCQCGYESKIENGVILCSGYTESTPFKAFENIESVLSITEDYGNEYISLMDKTYMWMYHQIPEIKEPQYIMAGPFTVNFLLRYCEKFSRNTIFIIIDPSLKRIKKLQDYMKDFDLQTVFIAGDLRKIPLKEECVNVYIDDFSSNNSIFTYNKSCYRHIAPLLKKKGVSVGIFLDYKEMPQSRRNFVKDHPDFIPEKMSLAHLKSDIKKSGLDIAETKLIGRTSGKEKQINRQVGNERIPFWGYKAIK